MIVGVGIDSVEIERFTHWHQRPHKQLTRVFSTSEIRYCLSVSSKSAERFAARFAAKEAFYKAVHGIISTKLPLLGVCSHVEVIHTDNGTPQLVIDWSYFTHIQQTIPSN